jgi:tRNA nucleotidyltransferase/poly(A) polymerase
VGGAVRDRFIGRETRDFDVLAEAETETIHRAVPDAVSIAARSPVLVLGRGEEDRIEISPLTGCTVDENLALRDFTLNAIAIDPTTNAVRDPLGGRRHLEGRRLVQTSDHALRDDPVRILRGIRLAAELDLKIEAETEEAMGRDSFLLARSPGERVYEELARTLRLPQPSVCLERVRSVGGLSVILPELTRTVGVAQNRRHPDDVYRHTLRVVDLVQAEPDRRLAALLHDVAKPETKRFVKSKGDFSFLRHELLARPHIGRVAERLRLSRRQKATVARLIRHHLLFPERLRSERAIRRMLRRVGDDILDALIDLRRADLASRTDSGSPPQEWLETVQRIRTLREKEPNVGGAALAISGRDVIRVLGIPEGPDVGRWLRRARQRVIEKPERNEREELLLWLERSAGGEID